MRDVAALGRDLTEAERAGLVAAGHWMFGLDGTIDPERLPPVDPAVLAAALPGSELREEAARFLTVMAFIDGTLDTRRIARVLAYADTLGIHANYIDEIAAAARGSLAWALGHMVRDNMESITGRPWAESGDVAAWMLPYRDGKGNRALAARYRELARLPVGTFGRAWLEHFEANGYAVPGEPDALNEGFATPHDSTHVFAGYDTTPRGEILVSTFTAAMHPVHPISGHVLPVIFSWHLGVRINDVAKSAKGALDPSEFWHAWARGERTKVDLFDPSWDFWSWTGEPLEAPTRALSRNELTRGSAFWLANCNSFGGLGRRIGRAGMAARGCALQAEPRDLAGQGIGFLAVSLALRNGGCAAEG